MAATIFNTENRTYRALLGNGLTYRIPRFQRDYSWDEEQWEDLWTDILATLPRDGEPAHYMGYLVLQTFDNRSFEVIDGQQRLTTLSLIVLAAMRLLNKMVQEGRNADANQKRIEQLRATYIGFNWIEPHRLKHVSSHSESRGLPTRAGSGHRLPAIIGPG